MEGVRRRSVLLLAGSGVGLLAAGASTAGPGTLPASAGGRPSGVRAPGEVILEWNAALLRIVRTAGAQPATLHPTRSFAMLHAAMYDAVVAVSGGRPYRFVVAAPRGASPVAAAAAAGHDVLAALYPAQAATLDGLLDSQLAGLPGRAAGVPVGRAIARAVVRWRATDGSGVTPPVLPPGTAPGRYRPTPPGFAAPVFTHWSGVRPFVLRSGDQYGVGPYPRLDGATYAAALNEVRTAGRDAGSTRTADQTEMARFWAAPIWNYWNEIAAGLVRATGADLHRAATAFADLNLAIADSVIAFYAAKYAHRIWRPVTAIRLADTDRNPATEADPAWNPLATTPPDPSYPGAHSAVSQTAVVVLRRVLGEQPVAVDSEALPGVTRDFRHLQDVADEAGVSRVYAGVHTRVDHRAGQRLGFHVGRYVVEHATASYGRSLTAA